MARLGCIAAIVCVALMCVTAEELYDNKFDDIDFMKILQNDQERDQYYKCFMDEAPCTTDAQKLTKRITLDVLKVGCGRCTEKQKSNIEAVKEWYEKNQPENLQRLIEKAKTTSGY